MAILATVTLAALIPADLAGPVAHRARVDGITTEEVVIVALRDYFALVAAADRDRGLPPAYFPAPVAVLAVHTARASIYDGILDALSEGGTSTIPAIQAWLQGAGRWRWELRTLREALSDMATRGLIRRVRQGVYARAAEAPLGGLGC